MAEPERIEILYNFKQIDSTLAQILINCKIEAIRKCVTQFILTICSLFPSIDETDDEIFMDQR